MVRVFVYGTLKPGQCYYRQYCTDRVHQIQAAYTFGQLYALPVGYPAMTMGSDRVWGHLLTFEDDAILITLDELEDYQPDRPTDENEYERQRVPVFDPTQRSLGPAWTYVMLPHWVKAAGGVYRPGGCWP